MTIQDKKLTLRTYAVRLGFGFLGLLLAFASARSPGMVSASGLRPVTVADAISMTRISDVTETGSIAHFSPNGKEFVVVIRRGNLATNNNEYSLLLWQSDRVLNSNPPAPLVLVTMASSSNRDAIESVAWATDSKTLRFLGENPGRSHQLYSFNVVERKLVRLSQAPGNLLSYAISGDGNTFAYIAEQPAENLFDDYARRNGVLVTTQSLPDLIAGRRAIRSYSNGINPTDTRGNALFVSNAGRDRHLTTLNPIPFWGPTPYVSPNGRYILVMTRVKRVPADWGDYADPLIHQSLRTTTDGYSLFNRYELIDLRTGSDRVLLNTPIFVNIPAVVWSPDSSSLVLAGVYLPLQRSQGPELAAARGSTFVCEVRLADLSINTIADESRLFTSKGASELDSISLRELQMSANGTILFLRVRAADGGETTRIMFRRIGEKWKFVSREHGADNGSLQIIEVQSMNSPPRLSPPTPAINAEVYSIISILNSIDSHLRTLNRCIGRDRTGTTREADSTTLLDT